MTEKKVSLELIEKALASLGKSLAIPKDDIVRDSVIQRFEYSFELAWKVLKKYFLWNQGLDESNVRNLFREAARQQLITDVEVWFGYHNARNMTSHTYDELKAEEVYQAAKKFHGDALKLVESLRPLIK